MVVVVGLGGWSPPWLGGRAVGERTCPGGVGRRDGVGGGRTEVWGRGSKGWIRVMGSVVVAVEALGEMEIRVFASVMLSYKAENILSDPAVR